MEVFIGDIAKNIFYGKTTRTSINRSALFSADLDLPLDQSPDFLLYKFSYTNIHIHTV